MIYFARFTCLLSITLVLAACGEPAPNGARATTVRPTPPAPPSAVYNGLMANTNFSVLYEATLEGNKGQLLWRQVGDVRRWDYFFKGKNGTAISDSMIESSGSSSGACSAQLHSGRDANPNVLCTDGSAEFDYEASFIDPLKLLSGELAYDGDADFAGVTAHCYSTSVQGVGAYYRVCLTSEGVPLSLATAFGAGDASFRAIAVNAPASLPSSAELAELPYSHPTGQPPIDVNISALKLPPIPALQAYLRGS